MTSIRSIGGEFALLKRISRRPKAKDVVVGIGDDAAVVKLGGKLLLLACDTLVENDHFSLAWSSPKQIGIKAVESNVSDIAAMGGLPKFVLISLVLKPDSSVEFVDALYKGIYSSCRKYGIDVVGGDISHGKEISITVSIAGEVQKKNLCLRSGARPGDFIMVSGHLGQSRAGLRLFQKKKKGFEKIKKFHLAPRAQLKKALALAPFVNAMEDVSDGLASEVRNICFASGCGAVIYADKIPIMDETFRAASLLGEDAVGYALFGGEDFELVFTVPKKNLSKVSGFVVGEIIKGRRIFLQKGGKKNELKRFGYDHFA